MDIFGLLFPSTKRQSRSSNPGIVPNVLISNWEMEDNADDSEDENDGVAGCIFGVGHKGLGAILSAMNDNEIRVPDAPNLNQRDSISLVAWVNLTGIMVRPFTDYVFTKLGQYHLAVTKNTAPPHTLKAKVVIGGRDNEVSSDCFTYNTWHHIAMTYGNKRLRLYFNAVKVAELAVSGLIDLGADPLFLGWTTQLDGKLDEMRLYSGELSQQEIQAIMNAT